MPLITRGKHARSAKLNQQEQKDQSDHQHCHRPLRHTSSGRIGTLSPNPVFDHLTAVGTLPGFIPDFFPAVRTESGFFGESSEIIVTGFFVVHERGVPLKTLTIPPGTTAVAPKRGDCGWENEKRSGHPVRAGISARNALPRTCSAVSCFRSFSSPRCFQLLIVVTETPRLLAASA